MALQITHRGHPVQVGAEKELSMKSLPANLDRFDETKPTQWEPSLVPRFSADQLDPTARAKRTEELTWQDLNDAGKAAWIVAYRQRYGGDPEILVNAGQPEYDRIDWEHTGELEVVSDVFNDVQPLRNFLEKFGWGHITTSFMRGVPAEERNQMLSFVALGNLYIFTHGLEERGADSRGEKGWRFTIKPLGIPTEEHLQVFDGIFDKNRPATAFSKHNQLNIRGNGKYGDPNRIAFELRAGDVDEKRRVQNALMNSLAGSKWGAQPFEWGKGGFRLVKLDVDVRHRDPQQVKTLPRDFATLAAQLPGVDRQTAERVYQFVAGAQFADQAAAARITQFDQRAATPLLAWDKLPFFSDGDRARIVQAQQAFVATLDRLSKQNLTPRQAAEQVSDAITAWAQAARVSEPIGRWLDGQGAGQAFV